MKSVAYYVDIFKTDYLLQSCLQPQKVITSNAAKEVAKAVA